MMQNTERSGASDPPNSEKRSEEINLSWENFKDFAKAIFAITPKELEAQIQKEKGEKKKRRKKEKE